LEAQFSMTRNVPSMKALKKWCFAHYFTTLILKLPMEIDRPSSHCQPFRPDWQIGDVGLRPHDSFCTANFGRVTNCRIAARNMATWEGWGTQFGSRNQSFPTRPVNGDIRPFTCGNALLLTRLRDHIFANCPRSSIPRWARFTFVYPDILLSQNRHGMREKRENAETIPKLIFGFG
jgi:hypothetical protein